jgi:phytoene dehydrogenase-like protein
MNDFDAIVIGSGAGGLTAAVALARAGMKVIVFEQHYLPGGWCHSFTLEGYQFSPGVHYIGALHPGGTMRAIYEGLEVAEDLTFLELNPDGFDHIQIGAERFDIPAGKERYAERLKARFPSEAKGIDAYLDMVDVLSRQLLSGGLRPKSLTEKLTLPWRLRTLLRYGFSPLDRVLDKFTKDPLLRAILSMQAGDHGMPPSTAPTALHASVQGHYFDGAWYPKGGAKAIPRAFIRQLRLHGGAIKVRAPVARILFDGEGRSQKAIGVALQDGTEVRAPLVISNADPHMTFEQLVGRDRLPPRLRRKLDGTRYSISCLSLFYVTDLDMAAAGFDSGNYWFSRTPDIEAVYRMATTGTLATNQQLPGTFVTVTTLKDRSKRSDGLHTMESFCFLPYDAFRRWAQSEYGDRPGDYLQMKEHFTGLMLDTIEEVVPGIRERIVFSSLGTPLTNSHYVAATRGNLYGIEKSRDQVGPFAYPVRTGIEGLLMCGASTLGHGVAGATLSGLAAAKVALRCSRAELLTGRSHLLTLPADHPDEWPEPLPTKAHRTQSRAVA